jgi:hypothetical protein
MGGKSHAQDATISQKALQFSKKQDESRFSMFVSSGLSVRGGVENINARGGRSDCSCAPPCRSASGKIKKG